MNDYAEKRDFKRIAIDCVLTLSQKGDPKVYTGNVKNLSSTGILFTASESFEPGSELSILLKPKKSITPPMEADAVVNRVVGDGLEFEIACTIIKIH